MKITIVSMLFLFLNAIAALSQKVMIQSSNQKIKITPFNEQNTNLSEWYLKVTYSATGQTLAGIPYIGLGLSGRGKNIFKKSAEYMV